MKEIDITSFLTPQLLEFISSNPDILNLLFSGGKIDEKKYTEELNQLRERVDSLEVELSELKNNAKADTTANTTVSTAKFNNNKEGKNSIKGTGGRKFTY